MTNDLIQETIDRMEQDEFNRQHGFRLKQLEAGHSVVEVELTPAHMNLWGHPHGGILFSLADIACGTATRSLCGCHTVTASSSINYLYASMHAKSLRAEGTVIKKGHSLVVVQAEVYDNEDNHLMTGQFTMYIC
ncbi:MAG: PaaI family thioesterase [Lachnospiraceae bacterium]|nr:PaaI family thioesterase [Lachnospiraceae bacterium]